MKDVSYAYAESAEALLELACIDLYETEEYAREYARLDTAPVRTGKPVRPGRPVRPVKPVKIFRITVEEL